MAGAKLVETNKTTKWRIKTKTLRITFDWKEALLCQLYDGTIMSTKENMNKRTILPWIGVVLTPILIVGVGILLFYHKNPPKQALSWEQVLRILSAKSYSPYGIPYDRLAARDVRQWQKEDLQQVLTQCGTGVVDRLLKVIQDPGRSVKERRGAILGLVWTLEIWPNESEKVLHALDQAQGETRLELLEVLVRSGYPGAIPVLETALQDPKIRSKLVPWMWEARKDEKTLHWAVRQLVEIALDPEEERDCRGDALIALSKIGRPAVTPYARRLASILEDEKDSILRYYTLQIFRRLGTDARTVRKSIQYVAENDSDPSNRKLAQSILQKISQ